jgi:hypothetical protein
MKTDKIDVSFLAKLLRIDELPERVYVAEGESRALRDLLRLRYHMIKSTTGLMNHLRGMLRQEGIKLKAKAFYDGSIFIQLQENKSLPSYLKPVLGSYERSITELQRQRQELTPRGHMSELSRKCLKAVLKNTPIARIILLHSGSLKKPKRYGKGFC